MPRSTALAVLLLTLASPAMADQKASRLFSVAAAEAGRQQPAAVRPEPEPLPLQVVATPVYRPWWFWTVVGVAVAGGAAAALLLRPSSDNCPRGVTACK
jgi:hypothetical protein